MAGKQFIVRVGCEGLGKVERFTVKSKTDDGAWRLALNQFFEKHPQALRHGLAVGGSIRRAAV